MTPAATAAPEENRYSESRGGFCILGFAARYTKQINFTKAHMQTSQVKPSIVAIGDAALQAVEKSMVENFLPPFSFKGIKQWPTLICKDGYGMSVQASVRHLCRPRTDDAQDYSHVEVSCTAEKGDAIAAFGDPDEGIYGFVPVDVVLAMLEEHGGVDLEKTVEYRLRMARPSRFSGQEC